jgi:energy-coupling factor transport system substrate-specific component
MTSAHQETAPTTSRSYRTIDLVTIATLGVAFGVIYWGWGKVYEGPSEALGLIYPPLKGLTASPWLIAGVVGGLILRKPGAALATELVAAAVSTLVLGGTQWGWTVLASGLFQGLGAELIFLFFLYRRWTVATAALAGALAGAFESVYEWYSYYPDWGFDHKLAYLGFFALSGAIVAGVGGWLLVRALARAGVLDAFPAGRDHAGEV